MTFRTFNSRRLLPVAGAVAALCAGAAITLPAFASSHREAPFITGMPKVDGTDLYAFRSYEGVAADGSGGRSGYVTILANYQPFQDPQGGPNFFMFDQNALYEIHIDQDGDAKEDLTFQFRFTNTSKNSALIGRRQERADSAHQQRPDHRRERREARRARTVHPRRGARRTPQRYGDARQQRYAVRQAGRQHRPEDLPERLCGLCRAARLQLQRAGLHRRRRPGDRPGVRRPAQGAVLHRRRQDLRPDQPESARRRIRTATTTTSKARASARSRSKCRSPA